MTRKREPVAVITEDSDGSLFIEDGISDPVKVMSTQPPRTVVVKRHRRNLPRKEERE